MRVSAPALEPHPYPEPPVRDHFDQPSLGLQYQTLRDPASPSWLSLSARPGHLRLVGRESLQSLHRQSLVARRVQSLHCRFETSVELEPCSFQQMAGLVCLYDDQNFYYACLTHDEQLGRCLSFLISKQGKLEEGGSAIPISAGKVWLRAVFAERALDFSYSLDGARFHPLGSTQDASTLSDEHTTLGLGFTGAFAGLCAQDLTGCALAADFDYLDYEELPASP